MGKVRLDLLVVALVLCALPVAAQQEAPDVQTLLKRFDQIGYSSYS